MNHEDMVKNTIGLLYKISIQKFQLKSNKLVELMA